MQRLMASGHIINDGVENLKVFVTVCTLQQTTCFGCDVVHFFGFYLSFFVSFIFTLIFWSRK